MKVLFVCSGNSVGISPIIKNQGESLIKAGISVEYFCIKGKGVFGYLKNIKPLRQYLRKGKYDIVHAHYSLSAYIASLAGVNNLCVSLMGSDVKSSNFYKLIIRIFSFIFNWRCIIVKSQDMYDDLGIKKAIIIPNGVDFDRFKPLEKKVCQEKLNWDMSKKHILFTSNPNRQEKNYKLAKESFDRLNDSNIVLHYMKDVPNVDTPLWYNAADVVLLTSLWEGSPNAIKEAMACNRPIVSTDVGDVKYIFGETEGCFITSFSIEDCATNISKAIDFSINKGITDGREQIISLGLDSENMARKIIGIYKIVLEK